jgi:hypothetical protein
MMTAGRALASRWFGVLAVLVVFACVDAVFMWVLLPVGARAEACPNATLREGPSAGLPDCRAYEKVTPDYTNGNGVQPVAFEHTPDGSVDSLVANAFFGFAGVAGDEGLLGSWYTLGRTGSGWAPTPISLPSSEFEVTGIGQKPIVSLDGSSLIWVARGAGRPDDSLDFYRESAGGSVVDLGPVFSPSVVEGLPPLSPPEEAKQANLSFSGVSADGSRVLFSVNSSFWFFDGTRKEFDSLYEYVGSGNTTPMLVGLNGSGEQISQCGVVLGSGAPSKLESGMEVSHNAVSLDGRTVFFTAYPAEHGCTGSAPPVAELFARVESEPGVFETVPISEPSEEDCAACQTASGLRGATFEGASADGSRVFFTTEQELLPGAKGRNLYEYRFGPGVPAGERVTRISAPDSSVATPSSPEVTSRVVQVSEDGSHLYFVAHGVLSEAANSVGSRAQAGADNLYVFQQDAQYPEGHMAFIADLCSGPELSGGVQDRRCPDGLSSAPKAGDYDPGVRELANDVGLWGGEEGFNQLGSDVTPDGRFLVFTSFGDLTADDTSSADQAFEYDSSTGTLVRVSIGQDGFNDNGNTPFDNAEIAFPTYDIGTNIPIRYEPSTYWSHLSVSEDGSYVFFTSSDGLTPDAVNDQVVHRETIAQGKAEVVATYAENVYEYHSTSGDIADGNVYLISDGQDLHYPSVGLYGTDASGGDVFFRTLDHLSVSPQSSEVASIYDARVDGGFASPPAPSVCEGDDCQGALSGAPTLLSPGSELQAGGNPPLAAASSVPTSVKPKVKSNAQIRVEKLDKALRACRKKPIRARSSCARQARKRYGSATKKGKQ